MLLGGIGAAVRGGVHLGRLGLLLADRAQAGESLQAHRRAWELGVPLASGVLAWLKGKSFALTGDGAKRNDSYSTAGALHGSGRPGRYWRSNGWNLGLSLGRVREGSLDARGGLGVGDYTWIRDCSGSNSEPAQSPASEGANFLLLASQRGAGLDTALTAAARADIQRQKSSSA